MTIHIHSVNKSGEEPPSVSGAPISVLFAAFLASVPQMISDERDMSGHPGWDPAIDPWFRASEQSLARTKAACVAVLRAPAGGQAGRALKRVAGLYFKVIGSDCPDEVGRLREDAQLRRWAYRVPVWDARAVWVNAQITAALDAFEEWLAIEDAFAPDPQDAELGPDF
jgi:hypothetical protein